MTEGFQTNRSPTTDPPAIMSRPISNVRHLDARFVLPLPYLSAKLPLLSLRRNMLQRQSITSKASSLERRQGCLRVDDPN